MEYCFNDNQYACIFSVTKKRLVEIEAFRYVFAVNTDTLLLSL